MIRVIQDLIKLAISLTKNKIKIYVHIYKFRTTELLTTRNTTDVRMNEIKDETERTSDNKINETLPPEV